jgi:IS30 family transposase
MMNHVNSYSRPNLGDKTPYAVFASLYGEEILSQPIFHAWFSAPKKW